MLMPTGLSTNCIWLLLLSAVPSSSSVCQPSPNTSNWVFTTTQDPDYSCASSAGATNDLGNAPTACLNDPASVRIAVAPGKAECLVAKSQGCKIPMHDFVSLDYDFHIDQCLGIWAAPLWMTPDKWQWDGGSGEIDSEEFCSRDAIHLNFAGGGSQKRLDPALFNINRAQGHITVRKDPSGIVTVKACAFEEASDNHGQCTPPVYQDCNECLHNVTNTYACWCNGDTPDANIYASGGCANGGDCMWTLASDIFNGVSGDAGYTGCMTAVPSLELNKSTPNLNSQCALSVEHIVVRGGGPNQSLRWGKGSPPDCQVLTTNNTDHTVDNTSTQKVAKEIAQEYDSAAAAAHIKNTGSVGAIEQLVERLFSKVSQTNRSNVFASPFTFKLLPLDQACGTATPHPKQPPCFSIEDVEHNQILVSGTSASELGAGVGFYLRQYANQTIGWKRGGGSNVFVPSIWPAVGGTIARRRNTPWSYIMNVCTHSYSLVWYSWSDWEDFLDWMSLSGINLFLAMTGQEEVQYKVFQQLGLNDTQIRSWFNGPALLTWSRGQNEYGSNIAGPLPRSWMKGQWHLQQQILKRSRSLGMSGQLPGFQGNGPIGLKDVLKDHNMTDNKLGTAWMDALDPHYAKIADLWMKEMIADFGTDHWWQLDGYFNGKTAPWLASDVPQEVATEVKAKGVSMGTGQADVSVDFSSLPDLPDWRARGLQAYTGLNRTDPDAVWSYQGWAFVSWTSKQHASALKSFIDVTPKGKFNVIDMSVNGDGEWKKWNNASFWDANFVWTTLHDFGGTDGLKGWLGHINEIPFSGPPDGSGLWGTGYTPEGIDQNPVYYEFMAEVNWREEPVEDIPLHISTRSHRRYGLQAFNTHVDQAWRLLVASSYAQDLSVQDGTGVSHLGSNEAWAWSADRYTPSATLCTVYNAWVEMIAASDAVPNTNEPFRYDLVNTGREILAQLTGPVGMNFTDTIAPNQTSVVADIVKYGTAYKSLLLDLDTLVATDPAFLLGPWLEMAKAFGTAGSPVAEDCNGTGYPTITTCAKFYEWNARVQLTSWNPTPKDATAVPDGPIDYASKHWSGLIGDYYAERVDRLMVAFVNNAKSGQGHPDVDVIKAQLAYAFTTSNKPYPTEPVGDAVVVSKAMHGKYSHWFGSC